MNLNTRLKKSGVKFVRGPHLGITEFSLKNGLRILIKPDDTIASAIVMTAYRVGSRNEGAGEEGGAHLFEHLSFKGSRRFNPAKGNNLDDVFKQIGGICNAYTSDDQTVYHVRVPAEHIEVALAIDADRMRFLHIKESDRSTEMPVVRQEMDQGLNNPDQAMYKLMSQTAFREHPYHHDTIGSASAVENVSIPTLTAFYNTFYHPNNATVIVMGNVEIEHTLALVQKHFGRLPKSPKPIPPVYVVEPEQEGERRFEIVKTGDMSRVAIGYHVPEATHADTPILHVLSHILGSTSNRASRLYASLMQTSMVNAAYAHAPEQHDPSLFMFYANVNEGVSVAEVEGVFHAEVDRLLTEHVTAEELARVKTVNRKGTVLGLADTLKFAEMIANGEGFGDWMHIVEYDNAYEAVTAEDIQRVAAKYLRKSNRTVGFFTPRGEEHEADFPAQAPEAAQSKAAVKAVKPKKERAPRARKPSDPDIVLKTVARYQGKAPQRKPISERIVTSVLPNGLTVRVLQEKVGSGVVCVDTSIKSGSYFESGQSNIAAVVSDMLPRGSAKFSSESLSTAMSEFGGSGLRFTNGMYLTSATDKVTVADLHGYLAVIEDVIRNPIFAQAELDRAKTEWTARFKKAENQPASVAYYELHGFIYEPGHPFHMRALGDQGKNVQALTVGEIADYHRQHYVPSATSITIVGDIDPAKAIEEVSSLFGDWVGVMAKAIVVAPAAESASRTIIKKMDDKPAVSIILGAPIELKRSSPDYPAARLAMQILGGDTLTAKLGKRVREELGLTYGIVARMGSVAFGWAPFMVTMSVATRNIDLALSETHAILDKFVAEGVTERELQTQMNSESGSYQIGLANLTSVTERIGQNAALGLSLDDIDNYPAQLRAVTVDEVNAAIKKYFDPSKLVTVIAGTV
jgi:zinc protease